MPRRSHLCSALSAAALTLGALSLLAAIAPAARADYPETILHSFLDGSDGSSPIAGVVQDSNGNLYGTSGTAAYEITASGQFSVLYIFDEHAYPSQLLLAPDGALYGTTQQDGPNGFGTVFKLTTSGTETVLHDFAGGTDGELPVGPLVLGHDGHLYGTTFGDESSAKGGNGTIFSLNTNGSDYLVQYRFSSSNAATAGSNPVEGFTLAPGTSDVLYSTTLQGGSAGGGTLFSLTPGTTDGGASFKRLHAFGDGSVVNDGFKPRGSLLAGPDGTLYGVTTELGQYGQGVVYKITPKGVETILYSFDSSSKDGADAMGTLLFGGDGNLYGTTNMGGADQDGSVFSITTDGGNYNDVYSFGESANDGDGPYSGVFEDNSGNLIGTTIGGGGSNNYGTVYKLAAALPVAAAVKSAVISPSAVVGGQANATETITLNKPAPSGGAMIALSAVRFNSTGSDSAVTLPSSLTIPAGSAAGSFTIIANNVATTTDEQINAVYNTVSTPATMIVVAASSTANLKSVVLSPTSVQGGTAATTANRVYLDANTTAAAKITLASSNPAVAAVPASVTIQPGYSSHTFTVTPSSVTTSQTVTITAKYNGVTQTATLTVVPVPGSVKSLTLSPASTEGGTSTTANRVYLSGNAPTATTVTLTSSNTAVATVPATVTVQSGYSSHVFTVTTNPVASTQTVTITATANGVSQTATLTVTP